MAKSNLSYSNLSYEEYVKSVMETISSQLSMKTYKRGTDEFPVAKNRDVRINVIWTHKDSKKIIYEFIIEKTFWIQKNTNDADRKWMRQHADWWLDSIRNMAKESKSKSDAKSKKKVTKKKKPTNTMVSGTQEKFERMKKI